MFFDNYARLCNKVGKSPTGVALELGISRASVSYWRNGNVPKESILLKIADYFEVSVDSLTQDQTTPAPKVTDEDLKVALFGGSGEVTDEMWEEVLQFAQFVKHKKEGK